MAWAQDLRWLFLYFRFISEPSLSSGATVINTAAKLGGQVLLHEVNPQVAAMVEDFSSSLKVN